MNNRIHETNRTQKGILLYRMIIAALGLSVVATMVSTGIIVSSKLSIPDTVVALGSAAVFGMAGFLVTTHMNR